MLGVGVAQAGVKPSQRLGHGTLQALKEALLALGVPGRDGPAGDLVVGAGWILEHELSGLERVLSLPGAGCDRGPCGLGQPAEPLEHEVTREHAVFPAEGLTLQDPEQILLGLAIVGRLLAGELENLVAQAVVLEAGVQGAQGGGQGTAEAGHGPLLSLAIPACKTLQGELAQAHSRAGQQALHSLGLVLSLPALQGFGPRPGRRAAGQPGQQGP